MSGPTFDSYDNKSPEELKQEQAKLRQNISDNKAGFIARAADGGVGAVTGVAVGAGALASTAAIQSRDCCWLIVKSGKQQKRHCMQIAKA